MTVKTKVIVIIVIGLAVIAMIVGGFLRLGRGVKLPESAPAPIVSPDDQAPAVQIAPPTAAEKQATSAAAVARTFVERFGSFSNQSGYLSFAELAPLTTGNFGDWLNSVYLPKLKKEHAPAGYYYEISTEAPLITVVEQTMDMAEFVITTERGEKTDTSARTFQQKIILKMKKVDETWRVDGAYWQNEK